MEAYFLRTAGQKYDRFGKMKADDKNNIFNIQQNIVDGHEYFHYIESVKKTLLE